MAYRAYRAGFPVDFAYGKVLLFSGYKRRMLASQREEVGIMGCDSTALIGFSLACTGVLWCPWALCLVLETTQLSPRPGVRYQGMLSLAYVPGG